MNFQEKVKEFQIACGQVIGLTRSLTEEEFNFRERLLKEEISELKEAIEQNDRVEILDALCDIEYVATGTLNMEGDEHYYTDDDYYEAKCTSVEEVLEYLNIHSSRGRDYCMSSVVTICYELAFHFNITLGNYKTALNRVHESNMSKFCESQEVAIETQKFYKNQGIDTYTKEVGSKVVVFREADGKVLKSVNYHPVELGDLV